MKNLSIPIDGITIHVAESGEGKPLTLVHGLGGPLMWQRVIEPLSRSFRVLVLDLPGFGESEGASRFYSVPEHAGLVVTVLAKLGIDRTSIAGISYGGQVAATFASLYPEKTERLVLLCSTGLMRAPLVVSNLFLQNIFSFIAKHILLKNKKNLCKKGERSFYRISLRPSDLCDKFFEQLSKPGHRDAWLNGVINSFSGGDEFKQLLAKITAPTLVLWGENDKTVPPEHAVEFQKLIRGSRVVMFNECAHSIPLEKPEEVCRVIN